MKVINWRPYGKGKLRGFFDVLTAEGFTLKGFKIMEGINGEFVSKPSQQKDGEYYDTIYCTKEMSEELLKMAKKEMQSEQPEGTREQAESLTTKTSDDTKQETDEVIPF